MRNFLSHHVGKVRSGASSRSTNHSMFGATTSALARNLCVILLVICTALLSSSFAQLPFPTSRGDNTRSGANTNETLLAPSNVNKNSFGRLFSFPVDYVVMAQPLYVPNVNIPGQGTHNVIYVVTQADSVYAIDAVRQHGALAGTALAAKRICRCHPWGGCGHDPVPEKNFQTSVR